MATRVSPQALSENSLTALMMMGLNLQGFKPIIICIAESTAVSEQFVDKLTVFIADSSEVEPLGQPDGIFQNTVHAYPRCPIRP